MSDSPANPVPPPAASPQAPPAAAPEAQSSKIIAVRQIYITHLELKSPDGQSYLDGGATKVVKAENEPLSQFLADARITRGEGPQKKEVNVRYYFGEFPAGQWRPLRFVTQGILDAFERAAQEFYRRAHADQNLAQFQRQARIAFRLPDPDLDPDSYWLVGDRFNPKLVILWGCEKLDANKRAMPSLPLIKDSEFIPADAVTVADKLRARLMSWEALVQENLDLVAAKQEPLGRFLARTVYDAKGEQIVGLRPVVKADAAFPIAKFSQLKKIPAMEIKAFDKAAAAFYARAHDDAEAREEFPDVSAYEREVRRNFRLPDVDNAAASGSPEGMEHLTDLMDEGKPGKGAPKPRKQKPPRISYWMYGKGPGRKLMVAIDGTEKQEECLYLCRDAALDIPPGARDGKTSDELQAEAMGMKPKGQTVSEKLWARVQTLKETALKVAAVLVVLGALAFVFLQYIYIPLKPLSAKIAEDTTLDRDNKRNVVAVTFNAPVNVSSIRAGDLQPGEIESFVLSAVAADATNAGSIKITSVKPHISNSKQIILSLSEPLQDSGSYNLLLNGLRPKFGRPIKAETRVPVDARDTRPPKALYAESGDSIQKLRVVFDEQMDQESVSRADNYSIDGLKFINVALNKAQNVAILTASSPYFEVKKKYTLTIHGVKDASRNKNSLNEQKVDFDYVERPPKIAEDGGVLANKDQLTVRVLFTKPVEAASATQLSNYDFGTNKLTAGAITLSPDKTSVEIALTNSWMMPGNPYTLHFKGVKDLAGNPGEDNATFSYTGLPDNTVPDLAKDVVTEPGFTALTLQFNKPVTGPAVSDGSMYLFEQDVNLNRNYQASPIRCTVQQLRPDTLRLNLSEKLWEIRYRLTWTNLQSLVGVPSSKTKEFVPKAVITPLSMRFDLADKDKKAVFPAVFSRSKFEKSSFAKENFQVVTSSGKTVAVRNATPLPDDPRGEDYKIVVELDLEDLPKEALKVTWSGVHVEGEPRPRQPFDGTYAPRHSE